MRFPLALLCLLFSTACSERTVELAVDLRTDMVAGAEFSSATLTLIDDSQSFDAVVKPDDFFQGARLHNFTGLESKATRTLTLTLFSVSGEAVATTSAVVEGVRDKTVRLTVARSCARLSCPGASDSAGAVSCLGSRCVVPTCIDGTEASCPAPECVSASDCGDPPQSCLNAECLDGVCLFAQARNDCSDTEYCDPGTGCEVFPILLEPTDAGVDASVSDTMLDAVSDIAFVPDATDASPDVSGGQCLCLQPGDACDDDFVCGGASCNAVTPCADSVHYRCDFGGQTCECIDDSFCGRTCEEDVDCNLEESLDNPLQCVQGLCLLEQICHVDAECETDEKCLLNAPYPGSCVPVGAGVSGDACSSASDCVSALCYLGVCLDPCDSEQDCGEPLHCISDYPSGLRGCALDCDTDSCGPNQVCQGNRCLVAGCRQPSDCAADESCVLARLGSDDGVSLCQPQAMTGCAPGEYWVRGSGLQSEFDVDVCVDPTAQPCWLEHPNTCPPSFTCERTPNFRDERRQGKCVPN